MSRKRIIELEEENLKKEMRQPSNAEGTFPEETSSGKSKGAIQ